MKLSLHLPQSLLAATLLIVAGQAHAALFSWGAATNIANDSDVLSTGALVGAFNVGDGAVPSATVNGVAFSPFAVNSSVGPVSNVSVGNFNLATADFFASDNTLYGSANSPFSGLSSGYQSLLRSATTVSNFAINPATFSLTMSSLTLGHQYKFEWFASTSLPGSIMHASAAGSTVTLNDNVSGLDGGLGQYAIGTFTADSASQVVAFSSVGAGSYRSLPQIRSGNVQTSIPSGESARLTGEEFRSPKWRIIRICPL